jgi:hypothetical protein
MGTVTTPYGWEARAVGAGKRNTAEIIAAYPAPSVSNNGAYFARSCSAGDKIDWFLGSLGEMKLIYDNLQGLGSFAEADYWTSTSGPASANVSLAISFLTGAQGPSGVNGVFDRTYNKAIRPIRSF